MLNIKSSALNSGYKGHTDTSSSNVVEYWNVEDNWNHISDNTHVQETDWMLLDLGKTKKPIVQVRTLRESSVFTLPKEFTYTGNLGMDIEQYYRDIGWVNRLRETIIPTRDLAENSKRLLGNYNYKRFCVFRDEYKDGWDFGKGKELSNFSISVFNHFMSMIGQLDADPSLFLTNSGNLQLVYEDTDNNTVDIEFYENKIEIYIESEEEEYEIDISRDSISKLIDRLDCISLK